MTTLRDTDEETCACDCVRVLRRVYDVNPVTRLAIVCVLFSQWTRLAPDTGALKARSCRIALLRPNALVMKEGHTSRRAYYACLRPELSVSLKFSDGVTLSQKSMPGLLVIVASVCESSQ